MCVSLSFSRCEMCTCSCSKCSVALHNNWIHLTRTGPFRLQNRKVINTDRQRHSHTHRQTSARVHVHHLTDRRQDAGRQQDRQTVHALSIGIEKEKKLRASHSRTHTHRLCASAVVFARWTWAFHANRSLLNCSTGNEMRRTLGPSLHTRIYN